MAINHEGKYFIPGTLVKGRLRQSWEELRDIASYIDNNEINILLGDESGNTSNTKPVAPSRGILRFSDFISEKRETQTLHRIRMDECKGTVAKGALLIMETPFAPGEKVCFHGSIDFIATSQDETSKRIGYIEKGLRWITSLGSERTVGFGKFVNVAVNQNIKQVQPTAIPKMTANNLNDRLCLVIRPKKPFCIAKRRVNENLFESEIFIPGSVIKGTLASTWLQILGKIREIIDINECLDSSRKELCKHFNKIRFCHAFPAKLSSLKRPVSPPLSLVKVKDIKSYYDVALYDKPILIDGKAPKFDIDWKDISDVNNDFGWPDLSNSKELRVRTAIDRDKRKAKEEKLFAYEMIIPTDLHWLSFIDIGSVPQNERHAVEEQLRGLFVHGLNGLGKTKASASVDLKEYSYIKPVFESSTNPIDNQYIVTLQTQAILCNPDDLSETSDRCDLFKAYKDVWKQISDSSLLLE